MAKLQRADGRGDVLRLQRVHGVGALPADVAEGAVARAVPPQDDEGRRPLAVALHAVGTVGLLTHGVQVQGLQERLDLLKRAPSLNLDLEPLRLPHRRSGFRHGLFLLYAASVARTARTS